MPSQVGVNSLQSTGEMRATAMDADEGDLIIRVLLDDLMGDPHERAAHVVAPEDDRRIGFQR